MRGEHTPPRPPVAHDAPPPRCLICQQPRSPADFVWRADLDRYELRCVHCRARQSEQNRLEPPFPELVSAGRQREPRLCWLRTRYGAKQRGLSFALSYEQYVRLADAPCAYCGQPLAWLALDRIENDRGYEPDNVVPCCWRCNRMKSALSADDFLEHVRRIARHWGLR